MSRGIIVVIIALGILITIISAVILISRRPSPGRLAEPKTRGQAPTTLTLWESQDDPEVFEAIAKEFTADNPSITIRVIKKNPDTVEEEAINALSAGIGPDLWVIDEAMLTKHLDKLVSAPKGSLGFGRDDPRSNTQVVKETLVKQISDQIVVDEEVFGYPLYHDTLALFILPELLQQKLSEFLQTDQKVNEDLLRIGPRTWEEFIQVVRLLTEKDGETIKRAGAALGTADNVPHADKILAALMLQNKTQMETPDRLTATFNLPRAKVSGEPFYPGTNALEFYTNFANPSKSIYTWNNDQPNAYQALVEKKVAMVFGLAEDYFRLSRENPTLKIQALPLPQISNAKEAVDFGTFAVYVVTKNSRQPELAWRFVNFAVTRGSQFYFKATQRLPPFANPDLIPGHILERIERGFPFIFQSQTARGWYRGRSPKEISQIFKTMINDVIRNGVSLPNATDKAAKAVTEIFRRDAGFVPAPIVSPAGDETPLPEPGATQ